MLQDYNPKDLICAVLPHNFSSVPPDSMQQHLWTVKSLSGRLGVCVWVPAPGAVFATALATSSCGRPTQAAPALN